MKGKVQKMEYVTENLELHYATTLRKCVEDFREIIHNMFQTRSFTYMTEFEDALKQNKRFNDVLEDDLVWTLNDWAIEEDEAFAKTILRCVDRFNDGKMSSNELIAHVSKLADLMELRAKAKAEVEA